MGAQPLVLSGVVTDRAGRSVANARVALAAAPVAMPDVGALTGEDGRFSFGVPVPGVYRVEAFGDEGHGSETVDLAGSSAAPVRLVLSPDA